MQSITIFYEMASQQYTNTIPLEAFFQILFFWDNLNIMHFFKNKCCFSYIRVPWYGGGISKHKKYFNDVSKGERK